MRLQGYNSEDGNRLDNLALEPRMDADKSPRLGFTEYAEILNGRLAMIGFVSLLAIEIISRHSF